MNFKIAGLAVATLALAGCGGSARNLDYVNSVNDKKVVVRPPLSKQYINTTFELPNVGKIAPQGIEPPGLDQAIPIKTEAQKQANQRFGIHRSKRSFYRSAR